MLLDLKDAFGSISYAAILAAFDAAGIGPIYLPLLEDIYTGNITQLLTDDGLSEDINVTSAVKQVCPLSGLAFNITIDPLFDIIQIPRIILHALGYADDTAIIEYSKEDTQNTINRIKDFLDRLGLKLNPHKCKSKHISPSSSACLPTKFTIGDEQVPHLETFKRTKYLGKSIGFRLCEDNAKMEEFTELGKSILCSSLAPWQKLDALKCFSSLHFRMP